MSSISSLVDFESFSFVSSPSRDRFLDPQENHTISKQHVLRADYEKIQVVGKGMLIVIAFRTRIKRVSRGSSATKPII